MSFFLGNMKTKAVATAWMLSMWTGVSIAQTGNNAPTRPNIYEAPRALEPFAPINQGLSSEEYEILVGLKSPNGGVIEQVPESPNVKTQNGPVPPPVVPAQPLPGIPTPFPEQPKPQVANYLIESPRVQDGNWNAYWQETNLRPLLSNDPNLAKGFELEELIWLSMMYSPRVQSILLTPQITRTDIDIARGAFDRRRFAKSNYKDSSDPVGNTLTTGGPKRLIEQLSENSVGIRDLNQFGGKTELSQLYIARDNNSVFFKPNNQADTKLSLNYTQPLLRGSGKYYNTSSIRIAGLKTKESIAEANKGLQDHAWDVVNAYWELVLNRYLLEQARQGQVRIMEVRSQLLNRQGKDLVQTQVSRANAAVFNQQGQIRKLTTTILGIQESIRRLVNAPDLDATLCYEIIPLTSPVTEKLVVPMQEELLAALEFRGDLLAVQERIEQAMVQQKLAVNELRPQIDFETENYVRGLRGNNDISGSFGDMFVNGRPTLSVGIVAQNAVGQRAAKANMQSRNLEIAKLQHDYSDALKKAHAAITSSVLDAEGTYYTTLAAIESVLSTRDEVNGYKAKFEDFMVDNPSPSIVLNDLLDAENRLINAESTWARGQISHMLAVMKIKYESGLLMTVTAQ